MISQRQRGFLNIYSFIVTTMAVVLILLFERSLPFIPEISILDQVDLFPYGVAIFLGMLASSKCLWSGELLQKISLYRTLMLSLQQVGFVAVFIFVLYFASKDMFISRLFLVSYLSILTVFLFITHAFLPRWLASILFPDGDKIPTLFIGRATAWFDLEDWIKGRLVLGMPAVGFIDDIVPTQRESNRMPYLGTVSSLRSILREKNIKQVVLAGWVYDSEKIEEMINVCESEGCRFLVYNNYSDKFVRTLVPISEKGHHFLVLQDEPLQDPIRRIMKRMLDIVISLPVVCFILPPLCVVVYLFQRKQAPGSLFFIRPRGGTNLKEFNMLKFRSMREMDIDPEKEANQAKHGDVRVYKFGQFLRRTSLDEFPQFINVLKGEMSVVGPRPHLLRHDEDFVEKTQRYRNRFFVKPGLTGLAQTSGFRGEITDIEKLHKRVYWDLYYITHWSIMMDIKIIIKTAIQVFFPPKNAY